MMMRREWAMPSGDTFSVPPIGAFVRRHLRGVSVDPFARNSAVATHTNDINPQTSAESNKDAREFLDGLAQRGLEADVVLFDPPYSPRQISECYADFGRAADREDTQNGRLYRECRERIRALCRPGSVVLSFGWNSVGMGAGFVTEEILLVCHGGAHNDTICMAERMVECQRPLLAPAEHNSAGPSLLPGDPGQDEQEQQDKEKQ